MNETDTPMIVLEGGRYDGQRLQAPDGYLGTTIHVPPQLSDGTPTKFETTDYHNTGERNNNGDVVFRVQP